MDLAAAGYRDDSPPYAESNESEEFDDAAQPPSLRGELPEELRSIMDQPIRHGELDRYSFESILQPRDVYYTETGLEEIMRRFSPYSGSVGGQLAPFRSHYHGNVDHLCVMSVAISSFAS